MRNQIIALPCGVALLTIMVSACGAAAPDGTSSAADDAAADAAPATTQAIAPEDAVRPLPPTPVPGEGHDVSGLQLAAPGSEWTMAAQGGTGGGYGPKLEGAVIYAIQLDTGAYVDRIALAYYIPSNPDNQYRSGDVYGTLGPLGGSGGAYNDWIYCPANMGAIGIQGHSGNYVDALGLICSNATTPSQNSEVTLTVNGGSGGGYFDDECRNGALMVGVNVRSGNYVDMVQGICNCAKAGC